MYLPIPVEAIMVKEDNMEQVLNFLDSCKTKFLINKKKIYLYYDVPKVKKVSIGDFIVRYDDRSCKGMGQKAFWKMYRSLLMENDD